jgi:acyl carrier protein
MLAGAGWLFLALLLIRRVQLTLAAFVHKRSIDRVVAAGNARRSLNRQQRRQLQRGARKAARGGQAVFEVRPIPANRCRTMTDVEIGRRVRVVIARELGCPLRRLADDCEFRRDLEADSLALAAIPAAIEDEFSIRLSDAEVEFCQTIGTAIDVVRTKLENKALGALEDGKAGRGPR